MSGLVKHRWLAVGAVLCAAGLLLVALFAMQRDDAADVRYAPPQSSVSEVVSIKSADADAAAPVEQGNTLANTPQNDAPQLDTQQSDAQQYPWQVHIDPARIRVIPIPAVPHQPIADIYPQRFAAAQSGDTAAALLLYTALDFCQDKPRTADDLQDTLLKLMTYREGKFYTGDYTATEARLLQNSFQLCAGVSDVMLQDAPDILRFAADAGLPEAQVLLSRHVMSRLLTDAVKEDMAFPMQLLHAAMAAGDAYAYFWAGAIGLYGQLELDRQSSLAYMIVANAILSRYDDLKTDVSEVI